MSLSWTKSIFHIHHINLNIFLFLTISFMNALFKKLISTTPFSKENDDADNMTSYPNHFSTHVSVLLFFYMNTKPTKFFGKTYHKCELQRDGDCTDP